jgi:F0F1-type ATP synthase delta subunit
MATNQSTAARRYAEAAFQLATRDKALDAYGEGLDVVNQLTNEYATEHNVQNPPLE